MKKAVCAHEKEHEATRQRFAEETLSSSEVEKVSRIFQMLAEPSRFKIVLALLQGNMCVYHLTEACGSTQSGVSHQLRVLRDNQIVHAERIGKSVEYSLADEHIREIVKTGVAHLHCESEK